MPPERSSRSRKSRVTIGNNESKTCKRCVCPLIGVHDAAGYHKSFPKSTNIPSSTDLESGIGDCGNSTNPHGLSQIKDRALCFRCWKRPKCIKAYWTKNSKLPKSERDETTKYLDEYYEWCEDNPYTNATKQWVAYQSQRPTYSRIRELSPDKKGSLRELRPKPPQSQITIDGSESEEQQSSYSAETPQAQVDNQSSSYHLQKSDQLSREVTQPFHNQTTLTISQETSHDYSPAHGITSSGSEKLSTSYSGYITDFQVNSFRPEIFQNSNFQSNAFGGISTSHWQQQPYVNTLQPYFSSAELIPGQFQLPQFTSSRSNSISQGYALPPQTFQRYEGVQPDDCLQGQTYPQQTTQTNSWSLGEVGVLSASLGNQEPPPSYEECHSIHNETYNQNAPSYLGGYNGSRYGGYGYQGQ